MFASSRLVLRSRLASATLLGRTLWQRLGITAWQPWAPLPQLIAPAGAPSAAPSRSLADVLLDGLMLMAVPKKRVSYARKAKRTAGRNQISGPKLQTHLYMCPVCERMRAPHRVCDRQDCSTYFKHKWF